MMRYEEAQTSRATRMAAGLGALILGLGLAWALISLPEAGEGLRQPVADNLKASGVGNPVTAVLLNFRGYDTLLEVGVLALALIGAQALRGYNEPEHPADPPGEILSGMLRVLVPMIVLFAGYLMWIGGDEPGGAFQSGAVLAAAGVVAVLAGLTPPDWWRDWLERSVTVAGLVVFALAALGCQMMVGGLLVYPVDSAKYWILVIEGVGALSIALILLLLFVGRPLGETTDLELEKDKHR